MYLMTMCCGQLCNQILYLVHVLSTALDSNDKHVVDLFAKDILDFSDLHHEAIRDCNVSLLPWRGTRVQAFVELKLQRYHFATTGYDARNPQRIASWMHSRFPKVVWSWCFRNPSAIARHRESICSFLRAKDCFLVRPTRLLEEARRNIDTVVGMHIRRGDYKEFQGGKLWFSDEQYLDFMKQAQHTIGGRVRFVIVSNEPVNADFFRAGGLDVVDASGLPQEDIVTLSFCDYIMGPSSTFSWWAAYYGNKPRFDITGEKCVVVRNGFRRVTD